MSKFPFVTGFQDGDHNTDAWSTRIPRGGSQFLLDIKAEFNFATNSETLRAIIEFAYEYFWKIAQEQGHKLESEIEINWRADEIQRKKTRRDAMQRRVVELIISSSSTDSEELKEQLLEVAEEMSKLHEFEWPPTSLPLLTMNPRAGTLLEKIKGIMAATGENKITLRELNRRSSGGVDNLRPTVEFLRDEGYVELFEETRSGKKTVWILIPVVENI